MLEVDFCKDWKFRKQGEKDFSLVSVPHDAMIYEEQYAGQETGSAGGHFPGEIYEYEKTFHIPVGWKGKNIIIRFEGVYRKADIFVNGAKAGRIVNGYTEGIFDLTEILHYGTENRIKVLADHSQVPNSRWHTGSGIYRPVTLFVLEPSHIGLDGVRISTISYAPAKIGVSVKHTGGEVSVFVLDKNRIVSAATGDKVLLEIPNAKLWSDMDPYLYTCEVILEADGGITDIRRVPFGVRKIEWSTKGLFINGQETLLRGGWIHYGDRILGACTFAEAEERKVRILKEYGYNAIRSPHNFCSRAMLDACDRLGMYRMDEIWAMWDYAARPLF